MPRTHALPAHLRAHIMDSPFSIPKQPKTQKARSLEDILLKFGPITSVHYEPFKCEPK